MLHIPAIVFAFASAGLFVLHSYGHEGPEHEVEELTERIKVEGELPDLLIQRAIEYKVLGKFAEAAKDLERALSIQEESVPARRELSLAYFELGKTNEAMATVTRALNSPADSAERAGLLIVRAGFFRTRSDYTKALKDASEAIRQYPNNVEWYLMRSQLQALLNLKKERLAGLEDGIRETGSGLLAEEWVDALIDDGQYATASEPIEKEMRQARWRAAWLIRRAKVRLATAQTGQAQADLSAALEELNQRLASSNSDALLLAERGLANDLLSKKDEARRDYRAAQEKGLNDEWLRERLRALKEPGKESD
jgi:tetratricopeptide (TPR) repeat protein